MFISPLLVKPIKYSFTKKTALGFYFTDHLPGFLGNYGHGLMVLVLFGLLYFTYRLANRNRFLIFLLIVGISYLAPLFLGTPPGITVIRGYFVLGGMFLILVSVAAFDNLKIRPIVFTTLSAFILLITFIGDIQTIFHIQPEANYSGVVLERGSAIDRGSKAAGYLIQEYLPKNKKVLSLHRSLEPPNVFYYMRRNGFSWLDLTLEKSLKKFDQNKAKVDVVICDQEQVQYVNEDVNFTKRVVLHWRKMPVMWIFTRKGLRQPPFLLSANIDTYSRRFDKKYSWPVSL